MTNRNSINGGPMHNLGSSFSSKQKNRNMNSILTPGSSHEQSKGQPLSAKKRKLSESNLKLKGLTGGNASGLVSNDFSRSQ